MIFNNKGTTAASVGNTFLAAFTAKLLTEYWMDGQMHELILCIAVSGIAQQLTALVRSTMLINVGPG